MMSRGYWAGLLRAIGAERRSDRALVAFFLLATSIWLVALGATSLIGVGESLHDLLCRH